MQLLINVMFGVPVAIGLYLIGVPAAVLWGILATLLRFIPYVGPWTAAVAPIGLSLAISTSWVAPVLTIGLFLFLELIINNVVEPWLYGKHTGVSAVALLVAAIFWTWLWGAMGLLLATPLTVCLLVIGKHVPQLAFLDTLLGSEPVFELKKRIYQRLLAGDQEEAFELLLTELDKRSIPEVYDGVLIPALVMAEMHWHHGEFDADRREFILQSVRASIEELGEREQATQKKASAADADDPGVAAVLVPAPDLPRPAILCLPAHDQADEIAAAMLAQMLEAAGCVVHIASVAALVNERVALVEERKPEIVCISSTPPAAAMHARYLIRQLRRRFPDMAVVVGLWGGQGDLAHARERLDSGPTTYIVASLAEAAAQVEKLVQMNPERISKQSAPLPDPAALAEISA